MNKIIVEVSIGELFDKISILEIKQEKIKDQKKLGFINLEHKILKDQLNQNVKIDEKINEDINKALSEINFTMNKIQNRIFIKKLLNQAFKNYSG